MKPLRLRAHAKLNLALRVGLPRADGYHPIAGVFQTISLCDLLYAAPMSAPAPIPPLPPTVTSGPAPPTTSQSDGTPGLLQLHVVGAELPARNTVTTAVEKLADEARRQDIEPVPLRMGLVKRVPMGAGLGGGSSDAAAALIACARLWELDRQALSERDVMRRIAAEVGSDVPFFLVGGTAMVTGTGERIESLDPLRDTWFVVAAPDLHVSTPTAYADFDRVAGVEGSGVPIDPAPPRYDRELDTGWMGNDLQEPVSVRHPEIADVRRRLADLGGMATQMTGSGAASFGAFTDRRSATKAARVLRAEGRWAGAFRSVDGDKHRRGQPDPSR